MSLESQSLRPWLIWALLCWSCTAPSASTGPDVQTIPPPDARQVWRESLLLCTSAEFRARHRAQPPDRQHFKRYGLAKLHFIGSFVCCKCDILRLFFRRFFFFASQSGWICLNCSVLGWAPISPCRPMLVWWCAGWGNCSVDQQIIVSVDGWWFLG